MAGPQRGFRWWQRFQLTTHRSHQNRQIGHRATGRPQHLRFHAVNISDRLYPGEFSVTHSSGRGNILKRFEFYILSFQEVGLSFVILGIVPDL